MSSSKKYVVMVIQGGLGKVICATPAIRAAREKYPDKRLVVVSGWPEVFDRNPLVHRTFRFDENKYLYEDYIKDAILLTANPYDHEDYRDGKIHLSEAFCKVWDLPFDGNIYPDLYVEPNLDAIAKKEIETLKSQAQKPVIVIQYVGRIFKDKETGVVMKSGRENLEFAEKFYNKLADKYVMIVMKLPEDPILNIKNALMLQQPVHFVKWFSYIKYADGFIGVDSSGHHIAAAFKKPAIVMWGRTSSANLGYDIHKNYDEYGKCSEAPCGGFLSFPIKWECSKDWVCVKSWNAEKVMKIVEEYFPYEEWKKQLPPPPQPKQQMPMGAPTCAMPAGSPQPQMPMGIIPPQASPKPQPVVVPKSDKTKDQAVEAEIKK